MAGIIDNCELFQQKEGFLLIRPSMAGMTDNSEVFSDKRGSIAKALYGLNDE